jgi:hypothetical protein
MSRFNTLTRNLWSIAHVKRSAFSDYAGHRGKIVERRINSNLLAAYKVRFADGKELWWTENELTPKR